ncbi:carbohydrate esterase family 9 protein [Guyanagaster necrorhizus]|uniref:Carbohydrate esterase family 9 protein n=1 Tax=Guyanagaster necrorhizus TaxID=856835 RepID=A0A9P8AMD2_9AGAR|nr:carbohydrate esterase family 9 protein [Guyanagaster necrorhizus MCA 3950]KAG7441138.1 carbohydrate esterase family 9 protein [Guyanagaster necrorhizus MCA 3950]
MALTLDGRRAYTCILTKGPVLILLCCALSLSWMFKWTNDPALVTIPLHAEEILQKCQNLHVLPGPPLSRTESDRYVQTTRPTLLKNAMIWTGRVSGSEVVRGDLLMDKGLIMEVGDIDPEVLDAFGRELVVQDVGGAWVSPGIVDLHSHLGICYSPDLNGCSDGNSFHGIAQPWLRSLDALNIHDDAYRLSIAGGITTALILPGSANAIGGQGFVIKLRPTEEKTPSSMLLEPPFSLNGSYVNPSLPPRWRQMKQACGENPSRVYEGSRMDTIWAFRQAYDMARTIRDKQDAYCIKALASQWSGLGDFPDSLQWEALVDVLRGRVKIHNHCYEAVDLDGIVRLSNEFKFPIAAFHHAHETYLVPDLLKRAYGDPPASAVFATFAHFKREGYRGSEFAARILSEHGLDVVMKSDHPAMNSRYLLHEAQLAHYYGLPDNIALASVTSTPAKIMGEDHRIGYIKPGYDADVVIWDSHPLALGATPKQVYIDGIVQFNKPYSRPKPLSHQHIPKTPDFDQDAVDAVRYDGLPPLQAKISTSDVVIFTNVTSVFMKGSRRIEQVFSAADDRLAGIVVVKDGKVVCRGIEPCLEVHSDSNVRRVNLMGGSIAPGLITVGSPLGLTDIDLEDSTKDGLVIDPLLSEIPNLVGGGETVIRAVDGLQFASPDMLLAYRGGVTTAVTAPESSGFLSGLSGAFTTGAAHKLEDGAVIQDVAALHVIVSMSSDISVSTQLGALRRLLSGEIHGDLGAQFKKVVEGELPLVVTVYSADIMASLMQLKQEAEKRSGKAIRLTFLGASEAHLLATEIGNAGVGVILGRVRPFPTDWQSRRILPGPPLSEDSALDVLLSHNVTVGIGLDILGLGPQKSSARNTRFDAAWAALEARTEISQSGALALASVNLETLLGVDDDEDYDMVVTAFGTLLEFESKVVGVISSRRAVVDLF